MPDPSPTLGSPEFTFPSHFSDLSSEFYSRVSPTPIERPYLIGLSNSLVEEFNISTTWLHSPEFCELFSGNQHNHQHHTMLAAVYSGHQFGVWAGQLGDGRALLLGDLHHTKLGRLEVQLKGAGMTPYSRMGDGRAVLRSSIREFLCSEAMAALGIPSSRALCVVGSDQYVMREQPEKMAVLTRLAQSFIRFGSFEHWYYNNKPEQLQTLADFVLKQYFPDLQAHTNPYAALLQEIVHRTAELIAQWQLFGFMHGVMNTDNMSILGITIDYGPFGFMDAYDPGHICNHSDNQGRYSYEMQPRIGQWNCHALAQAMVPLIDDLELTQEILSSYVVSYDNKFIQLARQKLGLHTSQNEDRELFEALLDIMQASHADFTLTFRNLGNIHIDSTAQDRLLRDLFIDRAAIDAWLIRYRLRLRQEESNDAKRQKTMHAINPKFILRNYLAQVAIEKAEKKDFSEVQRLLSILTKPFDEQNEYASYAALPPDWAADLSVSCSS